VFLREVRTRAINDARIVALRAALERVVDPDSA